MNISLTSVFFFNMCIFSNQCKIFVKSQLMLVSFNKLNNDNMDKVHLFNQCCCIETI